MIGIGIDTGGTCTDAVIYDTDRKAVIAWTKTETTRQDLKCGIGKVLSSLPEDALGRCQMAALSTTLATNACVENRGGRGKLILLGVNSRVFFDTYSSYGFRSADDVMLVKCSIWKDISKCIEPDWKAFEEKLPDFLKDCDCVSIVQLYSADHNGAWEKKAAEYVAGVKDIPIVAGHTLFQDRNAIRRGAGALLNARLVPVVCEFMEAIQEIFSGKGLDLPEVIIRSDGSQMAGTFALERPVETLLSGPAASVIGAMELADKRDAFVIDMGGTTTDIAIIKNGLVRRSSEGISAGAWKTFVKGLYIDTFGLGGDTAIHYDFDGKVYLEDYRVMPLCLLASRYPYVEEELKLLSDEADQVRRHPFYIHEYLLLQKEPEPGDALSYSLEEQKLIQALGNGPLCLEKAAGLMGKDIYTADFSRLEEEGILLRAGLTPTDIMHIRRDYENYNRMASLYAAQFVTRCSAAGSLDNLCELVYDLVVKRLYENMVRILLTQETEYFRGKELDGQIKALINESYNLETGKAFSTGSLISYFFTTRACLIGVGAPAHLFIPRLAGLLHTDFCIPEYAPVANAVGAIASQMIAISTVSVKPGRESKTWIVLSEDQRKSFEDEEEAYRFAREAGREEVMKKAKAQGAIGRIRIQEEWSREEAESSYGPVWFADLLILTARGKIGEKI